MEILIPSLSTLLGVIVTATVILIGHLVKLKEIKKTNEEQLIEQLQEENEKQRADLKTYEVASANRTLQVEQRATQLEERLTAVENRNMEITRERDLLRDYAHDLRSDIYDKRQPPPRDWPEGTRR